MFVDTYHVIWELYSQPADGGCVFNKASTQLHIDISGLYNWSCNNSQLAASARG